MPFNSGPYWCNTNTSEQQRETSKARQDGDLKDTSEILHYLIAHDSFSSPQTLHNIVSGEVAREKVDVGETRATGDSIVHSMVGHV